MKEKEIQNLTQIKASQLGMRLLRNNTGTGWTANREDVARLRDGSVVLRNARPLRAGLCTGSSDLIGWTPITITQEMVGKTIAVFTAIENKTKTGRLSDEQKIFIGNIDKANGITGVVRDPKELEDILRLWLQKNISLLN